jgi:hypothetical protein
MRIRAAITDGQTELNVADWESSAAGHMMHVWTADCKFVHSHLKNLTFSRCTDKRLSFELAARTQLQWMMPDKSIVDELGPNSPDQFRWIDTSTVMCDPLANAMRPDRLRAMLASCVLDLTPTRQSVR